MRASEIPEKMSESYRHGSHVPVLGADEWAHVAGQALQQPDTEWHKQASHAWQRIGDVAGGPAQRVRSAGQFVRANPWKTVALGLALGAAAVGGMLLRLHNGRRRAWW